MVTQQWILWIAEFVADNLGTWVIIGIMTFLYGMSLLRKDDRGEKVSEFYYGIADISFRLSVCLALAAIAIRIVRYLAT